MKNDPPDARRSERGEPLHEAIERYLELRSRGVAPSVEDFAARYPDREDEIRGMLSVLDLFGDAVAARDARDRAMAADATIPRELGGHRIVRPIGRGGMGVVFEAIEESLGRRVALKLLPVTAALDERRMERFRREAQAAGALHHANIVPVFGLHEDRGLRFYTMQYLEGCSLADVIGELRARRGGDVPGNGSTPWDPAELDGVDATTIPAAAREGRAAYYRFVAEVGLQVANALAYAHRHGVVHRDVKPSNLLLDYDGSVRVTDFGLAKLEGTGDLTESGEFVGTGRFMAPEQLEGVAIPQSDVYGLGATLYELLTLEPAFEDRSRRRLFEKIAESPPLRPGRRAAGLDADLENIVLRALEKRLEDRYRSAGALAADLQRFLDGLPVEARRMSSLGRTVRWCRRNPVVTALAVAVVVLLITIAVASSITASRLRSQLRDTQLSRARAIRWSGEPGRRQRSLSALIEAAAIRPGPDLRDELIAALHLPDLVPGRVAFTSELPFSPVTIDGELRRAAYRTPDGEIFVTDLADGKQVYSTTELRGTFPVFLTLARSGKALAIGWSSGLRMVDLESGRTFHSWFRKANAGYVHSRPDGKVLAYCFGDTLVRVDTEDGSVSRASLAGTAPDEGRASPALLAWSPDLDRLAVGYKAGRSVAILALDSMEATRTLEGESGLRWIAWHPRSDYLATVSDSGPRSAIDIWSVSAGVRLDTIPGSEVVMDRIAFAGDWHVVVDSWESRCRFYDFRTGERILNASANRAFVANDGRGVALWTGRAIELAEFEPGREYLLLRGVYPPRRHFGAIHPSLPIAVNQDGLVFDLRRSAITGHIAALRSAKFLRFLDDGHHLLAVVSRRGVVSVPVDSAPDGDATRVTFGAPEWLTSTSLTLAALAGDERTLYAKQGRSVRMLDLESGQETKAFASSHDIDRLATNHDGGLVAVGSWDRVNYIEIWDRSTKEIRRIDVEDRRSTPTFSPDGRELAVSVQRYHLFYDVDSWELLRRIKREHAEFVGTLAYSPDGRLLAYSEDRRSVRLLDRATGTPVATLESPDGARSSSLRFSSDGRYLSALPKVWDIEKIRAGLRKAGLDWDPPAAPTRGPLDGHLRVKVSP